MKNLAIVITLLFCLICISRAFSLWQNSRVLQHEVSMMETKIAKFQDDLKLLEGLPERHLDRFEKSYRDLEKRINLFAHSSILKTALEVENLTQEKNLYQISRSTVWLGIKQIPLVLHFYEIKDLGGYLTVLKFLETLERVEPLQIVSISGKPGNLDIKFQLYGGKI